MRREIRLAKGKGSGRPWTWRVIGDGWSRQHLRVQYSVQVSYVCNDEYEVKARLFAVWCAVSVYTAACMNDLDIGWKSCILHPASCFLHAQDVLVAQMVAVQPFQPPLIDNGLCVLG